MRLTKVKCFCLFIFLVLIPFGCFARSSCELADTTLEIVSQIRGLKVKRAVPCKLQSKSEVESYLLETLRAKIPVEKLKAEERVYKLLGFIPEDFDYQNGLIKLYLANLGGYYDPEGEYYGMASWIAEQSQSLIAAHELVHALQDQHFNLDNLLDYRMYESDALMAHSALAEGDAMATMIMFGSKMDLSSLSKFDATRLIRETERSLVENKLTADVPITLKKLLIFSYTEGFSFVRSLIEKGGYSGVDAAFANLPKSSEQILHPEVYLRDTKSFLELSLPDLNTSQRKVFESKPVYEDRYGEFFIRTWLELFISKGLAEQAARGWGGDKVVLYQESSKTGKGAELLVWHSNWDSLADAQQFFRAAVKAFSKRFSAKLDETQPKLTFGVKRFGKISLLLKGKRVELTLDSSLRGEKASFAKQ